MLDMLSRWCIACGPHYATLIPLALIIFFTSIFLAFDINWLIYIVVVILLFRFVKFLPYLLDSMCKAVFGC